MRKVFVNAKNKGLDCHDLFQHSFSKIQICNLYFAKRKTFNLLARNFFFQNHLSSKVYLRKMLTIANKQVKKHFIPLPEALFARYI